MHLVLVGADFEENLGMCMIAAAAESAGHRASVVSFPGAGCQGEVASRVLALRPDVVGLAAQFQHRGADFLALASELRQRGFAGHITAGGQFATMACGAILGRACGVDSVVLYEGEGTIGELLDALATGRSLARVAGLALPDGNGAAVRTDPRPLCRELDGLPLARRYRRHTTQLGVPFIPVSGSRGCWAGCSFCSITSVLRDAHAHGVPGPKLRLRSPADVGSEMALLAHAVGGSAVFCFHDENFLLPRPADSVERVRAMVRVLDERGVRRAALVGKCRPDTVTKELAQELARLGVIRMYVGVENASPRGAAHLDRRVDVRRMGAALEAFEEAGIYACYNLLVFEPETILEDVAQNVAFMRAHSTTPVNFCRAEPYVGTPMYLRLKAEGKLQGGFLGADYRIEDSRAELLFRLAASAFRERNFGADGVANRAMGLGYSAKLLSVFYGEAKDASARLLKRATLLTQSITLDTADLLEQAMDFAASVDLADHDRICRRAAMLGLRVAAADRIWHAAISALEADMDRFARGEMQAAPKPVGRIARAAQSAAMAGWLALWAGGSACGGKSGIGSAADAALVDGKKATEDGARDGRQDAAGKDLLIVDPPPPDAGAKRDVTMYDPLPPDAGAKRDVTVYDPLPPDAAARLDVGPGDVGRGVDGGIVDGGAADLLPDRPWVVDMVPPDAGPKRDAPMMFDPLPRDMPGAPESTASSSASEPGAASALSDARACAPVRQHWTDTSLRRLERSQDLPLWLCPEIKVEGQWDGDSIRVRLLGVLDGLSVRWQSQGLLMGEGTSVVWKPSSDEDQLDVAVRTAGGVAVTELRLDHVHGHKGSRAG